MGLPSSPIKIWGKSIQRFLSFDKQRLQLYIYRYTPANRNSSKTQLLPTRSGVLIEFQSGVFFCNSRAISGLKLDFSPSWRVVKNIDRVIFGRYVGDDDMWVICGWYVDDMWMISGWYVGDNWMIFGWYVGDNWMIIGWYVGDNWMIFGWYVGDIWMISGWYVGDIL